jgi:hypothetical protein
MFKFPNEVLLPYTQVGLYALPFFWSLFSAPPTEPVLWELHSGEEAPILTSGLSSPMNYPISGVSGSVVR